MLNTIEEFKEYVNIDINTNIADISMFVKTAERKFVAPLIGTQFYEIIKAKNGLPASQTPSETHLIEVLKDAIANETYRLAIPSLLVHTGSAGIQVAHTENRKSAFEWQVERLSQSYEENAKAAIESAIEFLLLNRDKPEFAVWTLSEYAAFSGSLFLRSGSECRLYTAQQVSSLLYINLRPTLYRIQNSRIKAVLCTPLYESMLRRWEQNTPSQNDKKLLDDIKGAMLNLAMAEYVRTRKLPSEHDFMPRRSRATAQAGDRSIANEEELAKQATEFSLLGERYLGSLKTNLEQNFLDYPEYEACMPPPQKCAAETPNKKIFYIY